MVIQESRPLGAGSLLAMPERSPSAAVLVLSGSSGRLEEDRVRVLARHGVVALAWRWFGGPGQPQEICEIPLESFTPPLELLHGTHPQLAVMGLSKGAEAALLLAARDSRITLTVAMSPTSVVWAGLSEQRPCRSSFMSGGSPLPFIPYDDSWRQPPGVPAFRGLYEQSLSVFADSLAGAAIPVEEIAGEVVLTAGGDDQVWPSESFVRQIQERRARHGLATRVLSHPEAGHRLQLPGESAAADDGVMARGGTPAADRALGAELWQVLVERLHLLS